MQSNADSWSVSGWIISQSPSWNAQEGLSPVSIEVKKGVIESLVVHDKVPKNFPDVVLVPGGVNAHVHPESNTVTTAQSAPYYARCGVTLLVTDFHEAANAGGEDFVRWNIDVSSKTPLRYAHGVPSSVPSDPRFERVGTEPFGVDQVKRLFSYGCTHLAELMAYLPHAYGAEYTQALVDCAIEGGYPVDGHCVKASEEVARLYFRDLQISTNHECTELDEARYQSSLGVKNWIRRGSAADDFSPLWPLLLEYPELCGFCTDDLHPDALVEGRGTFSMVRDAILEKGVPLRNVLQAWCYNPRLHYGVGGLLRVGDPADIVELKLEVDGGVAALADDPKRVVSDIRVGSVWVGGELIARDGQALFEGWVPEIGITDSTWARRETVSADDFRLVYRASAEYAEGITPGAADDVPRTNDSSSPSRAKVRVICATQDSLIKTGVNFEVDVRDALVEADFEQDLALVGSLNRYTDSENPSVMLLHGFGIKKRFAIVSSPAHDRHSPLFLANDRDMAAKAMNLVIEARGGLALVSERYAEVIPLPICGLMSDRQIEWVAEQYARFERIVSDELTDGSMKTPFMTLSFMGLIVIPDFGIGDDGLYRMGAEGPEPVPNIFLN
jgi:adenine deaminase